MIRAIENEYTRQLARWFGADKAFAFWRGRVALYAILKAVVLAAGCGKRLAAMGWEKPKSAAEALEKTVQWFLNQR